jgi:radical SAM protein with 4Fe4S-binding SPASM domain
MKRQKKVMSDQVFEKIVERVKAEKLPINKVFFSGLGEPLFDHQVISRLKAFKDMGLRVRFYTNASLLSEEKSRQMVELGLDEMNISFNGTNPEQYRKVMGLDFVRTRENIERLLEIRKEKHSSLPVIQVSLVLLKENEKDINSHRQNWQGRVDSVTVSLAHQWGGGVRIENTASWISGENWKLKIKNSDRVYPCRSLWHTFVLDAEGNFVLCCRDFESRFVLGNILTHSFEQIVQSPLLQEFRQKHLRFDEKNLPEICCFCNFPYQDGVEWYLPRSID